YADWLDDRSDPRGTYLRAEREAVVTGDITKLRELAGGLDPVWVARVSLPPLGVCCERFELRDRGLLVTGAEIKEVEQRIGVLLPADYRGFLLNYNGVSIHATQHFEDQDGNLIRTPDGVPLSWHQCEWRLDSLQELSRDLAGLVEYDQGFVTDQEI